MVTWTHAAQWQKHQVRIEFTHSVLMNWYIQIQIQIQMGNEENMHKSLLNTHKAGQILHIYHIDKYYYLFISVCVSVTVGAFRCFLLWLLLLLRLLIMCTSTHFVALERDENCVWKCILKLILTDCMPLCIRVFVYYHLVRATINAWMQTHTHKRAHTLTFAQSLGDCQYKIKMKCSCKFLLSAWIPFNSI